MHVEITVKFTVNVPKDAQKYVTCDALMWQRPGSKVVLLDDGVEIHTKLTRVETVSAKLVG
jgi:hypothetical protein